jgi:crotonobetaine/carnitine-CoA ligase
VAAGPDRPANRKPRGALSHIVWDDGRQWGDRPSETYLEWLSRHAREKPDEVFLDFEGLCLSYAELELSSTKMANGLADIGVGKGDTVVVLLDNSEDMIRSLCAVNKAGGIWVPINTAYKGEFLRHQVADCDARLAICDAAHLENLLAIAPELSSLRRILVRDGEAGACAGVEIAPLDSVREGPDVPPAVRVAPDDIACLLYTSGTTGPSKGCMISHSYLASIGRRRNVSVEPRRGEVTWSCLPLFHIASLGAVLIANILAGEPIAVAARFSVSGFWAEIERSQARSVVILASMLPLVAHAPDTPAMHRCRGQVRVVTGVPLTAADRRIWQERFGVQFMNSFAYGQTEANLVTLLPWGEPEPPMDSMGPPSQDFDVMVMGDDDRPVPLGQAGELAVRPRHPGMIFSGYWRRPEETLKAMKDLWWRTGDFVRMDENGFLYFVDRKKDYLRSRGENISSFEVESAVMKHPGIAEVAFHAVAADSGGEDDIKATVVLRLEAQVTEQELFLWARDNLPYFAVPRFIEFRAELPKTPTGRVQKHELRAQGRTAATWDCLAAGLEIRRRRAGARA